MVPDRAAEGDEDTEKLTLTVAHALARAEVLVVWEEETDTSRFVRVAFEEGVGVRQDELVTVTVAVLLKDKVPDALTEVVEFADRVLAAEATLLAVGLEDEVPPATVTDAVDVALTEADTKEEAVGVPVAHAVTEGDGDKLPVHDEQLDAEGESVPEPELSAVAETHADAVTLPVKLLFPLAEVLPVTEGLREAVFEAMGEKDAEGEPPCTLAVTLAENDASEEARGGADTEYESSW